MSRKRLDQLGKIIAAIGIICLMASLTLFIKEYAVTTIGEQEITEPVDVEHRILFISSYNPMYFTYDSQIRGMEESLYPNGIEYDVMHMDSRKYARPADTDEFYSFLKSRVEKRVRTDRYEAILAADDAALNMLLKYDDDFLPDLPVVFFGINDLELARKASENPRYTGFFEIDYLEDILECARDLYPDAERMIAVHDSSAAGKEDMAIFNEYASKNPDIKCEEINSSLLTQTEFIRALESVKEHSLLFYMTAFDDVYGNTYSIAQRANIVLNHAKAPVFRNYVGGVGQGVVGSIYMDMEEQAYQAGLRVCKVLHGTAPSDLPLDTATPQKAEFDYSLMEKNGLDFTRLPLGVEFVNMPETFMTRYGRLMAPLILLGMFFIMMMLSGRVNLYISRILNEELKASRDKVEKGRQEMKYLAEHDELLDIYNRRTAVELMTEDFKAGKSFAVIMTDIDGFKNINESFGHQETDRILLQLTANLRELCEKEGWLLARYGGDEMLITVPGRELNTESEELGKVMDAYHIPIHAGAEIVVLSASVGVSNSDGTSNPDELIFNAEIAMYEAKKRGGNAPFLFAEEMKERLREEAHIKEKLLEAFDTDGFYMLYQPQVNAKTKQLSGFEALVRMKEPGMYPSKFIPVAEVNGWIWKIGRLTTKLVIKQLAQWRDQGHELYPVSVNFSSKQLNDAGYLDFVAGLLKEYDIPAKYLEIEITEGMFLDRNAQTDELFKRMGDMGITLLMDDFGTGYSSLAYLSYIPAAVIKLDKSLVDEYLVDGKDSFIRDVIELVHDLDKGMIIEGVEEQWQFERLREFSADVIQGYFFSKPIPPEEAIVFKAS